jgi:gliding motility-associated-like protein
VKKEIFVIGFICLFVHLGLANTGPKMRRICRQAASTDNIVFFFPSTDTCTSFYKYYLWARNGSTGPFSILDSINNKSAETYIHSNANPGTPTLWYYFLEYVDSCGPEFSVYSDTLVVDNLPPDTVFLDSVSIDINTGNVIIGWKGNPAPDFLNFSLYRIDNTGNPVEISSGGTRDTSWLDLFVSGNTGSKTYDLLSRDSCNNPRVFGINPHTSMFLTYLVDTCALSISISWNAYRGWSTRSYYIYRRVNGAQWDLLDSVSSNTLVYNDSYFTGNTHEYYIRAFADTVGSYSSSSNKVLFSSRLRTDPQLLSIENITNNADGTGPLQLFVNIQNGGEAGRVFVENITSGGSKTQIAGVSGGTVSTPLVADNTLMQLFRASANDLCDVASGVSGLAGNLVLKAENSGVDVLLKWNKNPVWPVSSYFIYRAVVDDESIINYSNIATASAGDSTYLDLSAVNLSGRLGLYYVIMANRAGSGSNPFSAQYSNRAIARGETAIYIPNAFTPSGANPVFNLRGSFLDYKKCRMEIYDRWGGLVFSREDLSNGWNGKDATGTICPTGVYLYQITIFDLDGKEYRKSGTVTLLN